MWIGHNKRKIIRRSQWEPFHPDFSGEESSDYSIPITAAFPTQPESAIHNQPVIFSLEQLVVVLNHLEILHRIRA